MPMGKCYRGGGEAGSRHRPGVMRTTSPGLDGRRTTFLIKWLAGELYGAKTSGLAVVLFRR